MEGNRGGGQDTHSDAAPVKKKKTGYGGITLTLQGSRDDSGLILA
jgi:hypothetical protein